MHTLISPPKNSEPGNSKYIRDIRESKEWKSLQDEKKGEKGSKRTSGSNEERCPREPSGKKRRENSINQATIKQGKQTSKTIT